MAISAKDAAALRAQTGAGMMDCKKALEAANGDMDKATEILRERGVAVAAKKASRIASEGAVAACVSADRTTAALVEVNCESDFVAKTDDFLALANDAAKIVVENNPADVDALLAVQTADGTVLESVNNATAKIGEKIAIRRFVRKTVNGVLESYIHMGGKIGVLVEVETDKNVADNAEFIAACHSIAMHVAAFSPKYVCECQVPAAEVEHEKDILRAQIKNDPKNASKPEQIIEKMLDGRINKFYKEICLNDQEFITDNTVTTLQYLAAVAKKVGVTAKIVGFERMVMGEGLEKKSENFAEEIAKMTNK